MIFSAATFLYLLPLAGLPIVFHLLLKQKKRSVVFSTLMFFHRVDPKLNSRRQIREWLLLLLRVLMIALVLLALSRPELRSAAGTAGKLSLVVVIDNSGSMSGGAKDGDMTKLECAKEGARRLLSNLELGSDAAVVLSVKDSAVAAAESLSTDRNALLDCLDRVNPTEATGDASLALANAIGLLQSSTAGGGVIHVFTDLQRVEWAQDRDRLEIPAQRVHVYFHRIDSAPLQRANVAVTAVQLPDQRILVGQPYEVGLSLRNYSDSAADIRVNCITDRGERSTQSLVMEKQKITTVGLPIVMNERGFHWLKAWIEGDGFLADNAAGIGLFCEGAGSILFIGEARQFGMLPTALSPLGDGRLTGLVVRFSPSLELGREEAPILVVTTWTNLAGTGSNSADLIQYVEAGGNLLIVPSLLPGDHAGAAGAVPGLGAGCRTREVYRRGLRLAILNGEVRFWRQIERIVADVSAESMVAYAFCPLDLTADATPLLGVGRAKVVLGHKTLGKGNMFVSGIPFSPAWSTLPLSGLGVVMIQRMAVFNVPAGTSGEAFHGVATNDPHVLPLVAGERPEAWATDDEIEVLSLSGDALEWKGHSTELPAFPRAGVFLARTGDEKRCLSVRASPREGEYHFVEGSTVPVARSVPQTVVPFGPEEDYGQYHAGQARVIEMYIPLLLLLTLVLFMEGLLGASRVRSMARQVPSPAQSGDRTGSRGLPMLLGRHG